MNTKKILGVVAVLALVAVAMVGAGAAATEGSTTVNFDSTSDITYEITVPTDLNITKDAGTSTASGTGDYNVNITNAGSSTDTRYAYVWLKSSDNYSDGFKLKNNYGTNTVNYTLKIGTASLVPSTTLTGSSKIVGAPVKATGSATAVTVTAAIASLPDAGSYSDKLTFTSKIEPAMIKVTLSSTDPNGNGTVTWTDTNTGDTLSGDIYVTSGSTYYVTNINPDSDLIVGERTLHASVDDGTVYYYVIKYEGGTATSISSISPVVLTGNCTMYGEDD